MEQTVQNLEALEQRAERALEKAEQGWREFAETMREIKTSEAHEEAGYRYFQPYYRNRWEPRTGKAFGTVRAYLYALDTVESIERLAVSQDHNLEVSPGFAAGNVLSRGLSAEEQYDVWSNRILPDYPDGRVGTPILQQKVDEYKREKAGVIEHMEEQDIEIPEYPSGPTPEERAYTAASELLSAAMDVTPEAAADSISPGLADTVARRYEALIPWTRRFVAQLHLRSTGSSAGEAR